MRRQEQKGRTATRCAGRDQSACVTACVLHACMHASGDVASQVSDLLKAFLARLGQA